MNGVSIDNFRQLASTYLLSHFHQDHLTGLHAVWPHTLYASRITALCVAQKFPGIRCIPLSLNYRHDLSPEVSVTLFDANHCPGSVCFLVHLVDGTTFFHTGDFRWTFADYQCILAHLQEASHAFVDNTYFDPSFSFPPRHDVLARILQFASKVWPTQLLVAVDGIGKEEILEALARHLKTSCYLFPERYELVKLVCANDAWCSPFEHIGALPKGKALVGVRRRYLKALMSRLPGSHGISPTGWHDTEQVVGNVFECPYSLHCDYAELLQFVSTLAPTCSIHLNSRAGEASVRDFSDLVDGRRVTWQCSLPRKRRHPEIGAPRGSSACRIVSSSVPISHDDKDAPHSDDDALWVPRECIGAHDESAPVAGTSDHASDPTHTQLRSKAVKSKGIRFKR